MAESANQEPADGLKAKFREALARKNAISKGGEAHRDGSSKVGNVHGSASAKREFRRKSG